MQIKSAVASDTSYSRGLAYYEKGLVTDMEETELGSREYEATVTNPDHTASYDVYVKLSRKGDSISRYECSCPAAAKYLGACKHVVAVLKQIQEEQEELERPSHNWLRSFAEELEHREESKKRKEAVTDESGKRMFELFARNERHDALIAPSHPQLVPRLFVDDYYGNIRAWLEFRIGEDKLFVLKNIREFYYAMRRGEPWPMGKYRHLETAHVEWADERSKALWNLIEESMRDEGLLLRSVASRYDAVGIRVRGKTFILTNVDFTRFLDIMGDAGIETVLNGGEPMTLFQAEGLPHFSIKVREEKRGAMLRYDVGDFCPLSEDYSALYQSGAYYRLDKSTASDVALAAKAIFSAKRITVSEADMARFFGEVLPRIERIADVEVAPSFYERFHVAPLTAELYIDYYRDGIAIRVEFVYGDVRFNPMESEGPKADGQHIVRDMSGEASVVECIRRYGFRKNRELLVQKEEEPSYDFLTEALPAFPEWVEVYYAEAFKERPVRPMPKVKTGVSVNDSDLLEVTFDTKGIDTEELFALLESYRQKKRYHRMKDRSFVPLSAQQLSGIAALADDLGLGKRGKGTDGKFEMPLANALYLDELSRHDESIEVQRSKSFRSVVRGIRHPEDVDIDIPDHLMPILRDYQLTGIGWLSALAAHHLGGILADDMGLGKTLQVLAFLASQDREGQPPTLVVAPTSLLYNWLDEAEKFVPELTAVAITGTKGEREEALAKAYETADILVTTYNMLRRDIEEYTKRKFQYVFLDEAQHIKNPATQAAKAVKKLSMGGCFALTGTPIENTLTELWSIFDFLMPGYLFGHTKFKQRFETPIVRAEDKKAAEDLRRHIAPFILRRMKKDVLKELPDKVERKLLGEMTEEQDKVYKAWFLKSQKEFQALLKEQGSGEGRIRILAILTRLRQIACDPALFLENYHGGSGKLDMLEELAGEAVEGGHRILIFSQFTSMLARIAKRLEKMGIEHYYLDGSTPALERISLVKSFNSSGAPVFLISLKAGGTGLNLTGADMVIHFDPWWNPAVEDQATDRAYRLGQKNNVQVVKLITKNTVEEKIYHLQEKKKNLVDQMIQPGETFLSKLTEEELQDLFAL